MNFVAYVVVHTCRNVFFVSGVSVNEVLIRFTFDGRGGRQIFDDVAVIVVRRCAEHIEDGFFGRHFAVVAQRHEVISRDIIVAQVGEVAIVCAAFLACDRVVVPFFEKRLHKRVAVKLRFDLSGEFFRFCLLFEGGNGNEHHKHYRANRTDDDKRRTATPLFDEFAVSVVAEFAEKRQHKERQEVVKPHNKSARPTRQAVCVFQKKRNDKVVCRPEQHNDCKRKADLEGLRIVEFERRSAFLVEHRCGFFLFTHNNLLQQNIHK